MRLVVNSVYALIKWNMFTSVGGLVSMKHFIESRRKDGSIKTRGFNGKNLNDFANCISCTPLNHASNSVAKPDFAPAVESSLYDSKRGDDAFRTSPRENLQDLETAGKRARAGALQ